jgi:hypothetical protein
MRMWLAFTESGLELDEENITGPLEQRSHQATSVTKYGHGSKTGTDLNAYPATNLGETNLSIPSTKVSPSPAFSSNKYPSKLLEKFMFLERKVSSTLQGGIMEKLCFFNWISIVGLLGWIFVCVEGLGVNWGTRATHKLPQETLIKMRKDSRNRR